MLGDTGFNADFAVVKDGDLMSIPLNDEEEQKPTMLAGQPPNVVGPPK